ncbi:PH domain-containing protein [Leptospira levettii]|uniref:PH domain-containing protein n=1 Tax=Leptospira levettii TaxID=2023178 RepID=UPI001083F558|nr:PH domain-containing protein [Leptospira levettii]
MKYMDYKTKKGFLISYIIMNCFYLYILIPWIITSKTEKHKRIIINLKNLFFSYTTSFNIQTKGILISYGFKQKIEELILYETIESINFTQSFFQQLTGEGDIHFSSYNSLLKDYIICFPTEFMKIKDLLNQKITEFK